MAFVGHLDKDKPMKTPLLKNTCLLAALQDIHAYNDAAAARKETLHRTGRTWLRQLAKELGMQPGSYDVRSNKGGIAVSGEVTLHADTLYVQLSESCITGGPGVDIMYRTCRGRSDYSGSSNNFAAMAKLADADNLDRLVDICRKMAAVAPS
jgi:hypothetical protein